MTDQLGDHHPIPCGLGRRLLAIIYDTVVVLGLLLLATAVALPWTGQGQQALRDPFFTVYLAAVWFLYLAWCWRKAGMTPGMRAWRIRLVADAGGAPGWGQCLLRFLAGIAGAAALGAGLLWALADRRRRCWQDLVSGTRLVLVERDSDRSSQEQDSAQTQ